MKRSNMFIFLAVAVISIGTVLGFLATRGSEAPTPTSPDIACTQEAKICPDGSAVGRQAPNCQFTPCPGEAPAIKPK